MLTALRSRCSPSLLNQSWKLAFSSPNRFFASSPSSLSPATGAYNISDVLTVPEVEKILADVKADNVTVIPTKNQSLWADFTIIATGRSDWHLRNIAQALVYKAKQKQKGAKQIMLPSVQGYNSKWIVIDYGKFVVHALDEKARVYFNLESLWTAEKSDNDPSDQVNKFICVFKDLLGLDVDWWLLLVSGDCEQKLKFLSWVCVDTIDHLKLRLKIAIGSSKFVQN